MSNSDATRRIIYGHDIYSNHLEESRTIKVYVPPGYSSLERYPVLYCHDGSEFFTHGRIGTIAQSMILAGELPPLVIVGAAVNMKRRNDDYAPNGARHQAYLRFILDECIPYVEGQYSVRTDADGRFMAGVSLGAAVSLSLYLHNRSVFKQFLLFSGAYYDVLQDQFRHLRSLGDLSAYMTVGRQETAVETVYGSFDFYQLNQRMRDVLAVRGADISYEEADGKHIWGFWQSRLPEALRWLATRAAAKGQRSAPG